MVKYSDPCLLSTKGSTRATAYWFGNKSVALGGKTHVVWLDAVAQVCGRTYDHTSKTWEETVRLFEGCDNHTNPVLTADAQGHLHLAYGPHGWGGKWNHGRFKHVVSEQPGSLESWKDEISFGYNATYACLINTPSGLDCIAYRGGEPPSPVMFQKQRPSGGWTPAQALMRQEIEPQYTNVGATIVCDAQGTLYVAGHFYNHETNTSSAGAAVLKSTDMGETWTDLTGEPTPVPILYGERFAIPHPGGENIYLSGLAVDSKGELWTATTNHSVTPAYAQLSHWTGGGWETIDMAPFLPEDRIVQAGPIALDTNDRIHMVVGLNRMDAGGSAWGNPSQEVFHLISADRGKSFACNQVSTPDDSTASWLPSISFSGTFHPVEKPVILYTHGVPGEGLKPDTNTEVYCVMVEEMD